WLVRRIGRLGLACRTAGEERCRRRNPGGSSRQGSDRGFRASARRSGEQREGSKGHLLRCAEARAQPVFSWLGWLASTVGALLQINPRMGGLSRKNEMLVRRTSLVPAVGIASTLLVILQNGLAQSTPPDKQTSSKNGADCAAVLAQTPDAAKDG